MTGVVRRYVRTGIQRDDERVEVLSGQKPGGKITLPSNEALFRGPKQWDEE